MKKLLGLLCLLSLGCVFIHAENRWMINSEGGITWKVDKKIPHEDHIEMSGLNMSTVLRYGVDEHGTFMLNRSIIWPMLRTIPNNTHGFLMRRFAWNVIDMLVVDWQSLKGEKVESVTLNGTMEVESKFRLPKGRGLHLTRTIFPSAKYPTLCEKYVLKNVGKSAMTIEIPSARSVIETDASKGVDGSYRLISTVEGTGSHFLKPGEELCFYAHFAGYKQGETERKIDIEQELKERRSLVSGWWDKLVLETPDSVINTMFAFAKIRAAESIYETKGGLMHGPGGESFYAAVWANDQAEYINPFFPYLGYDKGNESSLCSYEHFARFMNEEYKPIPSSIIAEGIDIWHGAGDRGDGAMLAYGASRYALARGSKEEAQKLWPLIEWTLEYCKRKLNKEGVVTSDSDELENRFPAGEANLCTSSLYYDALCSATYLGKDLGKPAVLLNQYKVEAKALKENIESYFGHTVEGFETYQYYAGNDILRAWICMPLTVGIYDRKEETINALFSPRLWTENGLLTQAGTKTFWDRSTLYALRGVFACGATEKGLAYLKSFSTTRLLGEHVPYAIEAWPEGNQRHLSAESGLYCRIITEGMFGIRPAGLRSFILTPRLPETWNYMNLKNICAYGHEFDINISRVSNRLKVSVLSEGKVVYEKKVKENAEIQIKLD